MKTLVIHPADATTQFLAPIYEGKDWTICNNYKLTRREIKDLIYKHDRIIMMGHGDVKGLWNPDHSGYLINSQIAWYLKPKRCVYIWCNSDSFVRKHNLQGFYTGMIISEWAEAHQFALSEYTNEDIEKSNELFTRVIKNAIDSENMYQQVKANYISDDNAIVWFNQNNIHTTI